MKNSFINFKKFLYEFYHEILKKHQKLLLIFFIFFLLIPFLVTYFIWINDGMNGRYLNHFELWTIFAGVPMAFILAIITNYIWNLISKSGEISNIVKITWPVTTKGIKLTKKIVWPENSIDHHAVSLGATGLGKTQLIYKIIKNTDRKCIFINGKYDINNIIEEDLKNLGVKTLLIDFNNNKIQYNPFKGKTITEVKALYLEMGNFSDIMANTKSGQNYYMGQEEHAIELILEAILEKNKLNKRNIDKDNSLDIRLDIMGKYCQKEYILKIIKNTSDEKGRVLNLKKQFYYDILKGITKVDGDILFNIQRKIRKMQGIKCLSNNKSGYSLEELIKHEKRCIIFDINPTSTIEGQHLAKIIQYDLKQYKDKISEEDNNSKILVLMDEYDSYSSVHIKDLLTQARSKNISIFLSFQDPAQLMTISKDITSTIFSNAHSKFIFRFSAELEFLVKLIGDKKVFENTIQIQREKATGLGSKKLQSTFKLSPEKVRNLGVGECFFITIDPKTKKEIWPVLLKLEETISRRKITKSHI